jgi:hypothetical protein
MPDGKIIHFIHENFSKDEAEDIEKIVVSMNMTKLYDHTVAILVDESMPKDEVVIANLATGLLTSVSYKAGQIEDQNEKHFTLAYFARLTERLLILLVSENLENSTLIFETLEKSLRVTCVQFGYDFKMLKQFFDFEKLKMIVDSLKIRTQESNKDTKVHKKQRYCWADKADLSILVEGLFKENFIKNKKELFDLFLKPKEEAHVRWNNDKKSHLAYFLNRIFTGNFAKVEGNKGYFTYAEKHFINFEQEAFTSGSLKKISSQISLFPEEHKVIIKEIDDLLEASLQTSKYSSAL